MIQGLIIYDATYFTKLVSWLEHHMLPCYFKYFFGLDCPGCGLQRSIILLIQGNLLESIKMYPPLLPIVFVLMLHFANKRIAYNGQAYIFKFVVWMVASIIAANFFLNLLQKLLL